MRRSFHRVLLAAMAASASLTAIQAHAQSSSDVVVMRRVIAPPQVRPVGTPTPTPDTAHYGWVVSPWSTPAAACNAQVTETRTVVCKTDDGTPAEDAKCLPTGAKPASEQVTVSTASCQYAWEPGAWTNPPGASSCGSLVQTRSVQCVRSDHVVVDGSNCSGDAPAASQNVSDYSGCNYTWVDGAWSAPTTTCGVSHDTRSVICQRSDGTTASDEGKCAGSGTKPETTRDQNVTTGCSYSWDTGPWGTTAPACGASTQSRTVTCKRSDGTAAADPSSCTAEKPATTQPANDYSTCGDGRDATHPYNWTVGAFTPPSTTCGDATATRSVQCLDDHGATAADALCVGSKPSTTQSTHETSGCSYTWTPQPWGATVPACGASTHSRAVLCMRGDGQQAPDSASCGTPAYATTEPANDYSTCTYNWNPGAWTGSGACGATVTQTRTVTCQRSDGTTMPDESLCVAAKGPKVTSQQYTDYSQCSYSWKTNPGAWSSTCSTSATQSNNPYCQRQDGATAPNESYCDPASKPALQNVGNLSGCSYTPVYAFGICEPQSQQATLGTQAASVSSCTRGDGQTVPNTTAQCIAGLSSHDKSCTLSYVSTYSTTYGACSPSTFGQTTGTQTAPTVACTMNGSDGSSRSIDKALCPSQVSAPKSCTVSYTYVPTYSTTYSTCVGGNQTAPIVSCRATASDSSSGNVSNSLCSPQTTNRTCIGTVFTTGFEAGDAAGNYYGGSVVSTARPKTGTKSLLLPTFTPGNNPFSYFGFNAVAGVTYTLTMSVYFTTGSNGGAPHIYSTQPGGALTDLGSVGGGGWQVITKSFTVNANGFAYFSITAFDQASPTYVDDITISS